MRVWVAAFVGLAGAWLTAPAAAQDMASAAAAASELRDICRDDAGQLWGVSLCGPLMVADPVTRRVWTSDPDELGVLEQSGLGWVGALPPEVAVANTTLDWAGVRWIQVMAPLPADRDERRVLLAHEAWHRAQTAVGLAAQPSNAAHLEEERARVLMRLEFRALGIALRSAGRGRREAVAHALMMRAARLSEFPGAAGQEAALDRNEGLAAYTGVRLAVEDNPDLYAARLLDRYDRHETLARAYAYATGPAYGLLLDGYRPNWRQELGGQAPADLLRHALRLSTWTAAELRRAGERYGITTIAAEERALAETKRARIAELRQRFEQGPRLELPLQDMQMVFNPQTVIPVEGLGAYYGTITVRDAWGELQAEEGALISEDFTRLLASTPGPGAVSGPGWRLTLAPGFQLVGPDGSGVFRPLEIPADAPEEAPPT